MPFQCYPSDFVQEQIDQSLYFLQGVERRKIFSKYHHTVLYVIQCTVHISVHCTVHTMDEKTVHISGSK